MKIETFTPEENIVRLQMYLHEVMINLRRVVVDRLKRDFNECILYGMIGIVIIESCCIQGHYSYL